MHDAPLPRWGTEARFRALRVFNALLVVRQTTPTQRIRISRRRGARGRTLADWRCAARNYVDPLPVKGRELQWRTRSFVTGGGLLLLRSPSSVLGYGST
jgi:hypothetical protein